ncbi:MAG: glycosyltransferase family 2 protein, partial [Cyanobacteria bacterium P01_H01_bin.130]
DQGYRYQEGDSRIYRKRKRFYKMCGSCNIIRLDLSRIPEVAEFNRGYGSYKRYIDHWRPATEFADEGNPLEPLPFPGAVYMTQTGENLYFNPRYLSKNPLRFLMYKTLTPEIREEFGIYPLRDR